MKKFVIFLLCLVASASGFSSILFSTQYNAGSDVFEVWVTSTIDYANFQQGSSTVAILFEPGYDVSAASVTASANGGPWTAQDKGAITVAGALNGYKFINFLSSGSAYPLPANTPVKLFSFAFSPAGTNCGSGLKQRHVINPPNANEDPVDPTSDGTYDLTSFLFSPATGQINSSNTSTSFQGCPELSPLPVRFLSFTATKNGNNALVNWKVANEDPLTQHYELERSVNKIDFTMVASVPAKNNGNTNNSYDFTDQNLSGIRSSGLLYYRLKQVDANGNFAYSEIRILRLNGNGFGVYLFPNPAKSFANVTIDLEQALAITMRITDVTGKEIKRIEMAGIKGTNIKKIDLTRFAAGSYMLNVNSGDQYQTVPLVKGN